jgi:cytochrome c oxidase subunit 4
MENEQNHIIPYRTFLFVLTGLISLTLISVSVTQISLGTLTVAIALLIAVVKSIFVLRMFIFCSYCCISHHCSGNFYNSSGLSL